MEKVLKNNGTNNSSRLLEDVPSHIAYLKSCKKQYILSLIFLGLGGTLKTVFSSLGSASEEEDKFYAFFKWVRFFAFLFGSPIIWIIELTKSISGLVETNKHILVMSEILYEVNSMLSNGETINSPLVANKLTDLEEIMDEYVANRTKKLPHYIFYLVLVDALKRSGYEVEELENKSKIVRSSVSLKGVRLGEVFTVDSLSNSNWSNYQLMKEVAEVKKKDFEHDFWKFYGKSPDTTSLSYWPEDSLVGAWISPNYDEKSDPKQRWLSSSQIKWLSIVADIFERNRAN